VTNQVATTDRSGGPSVELLWFSDCPNHESARRVIRDLIDRIVPDATFRDTDATDPAIATAARFPGSPTIRVDGVDIDPSYVDPGDYTPRCRLYRTRDGLRGLPEAEWIADALRDAGGAAADPG
jgi:hypothetical protein